MGQNDFDNLDSGLQDDEYPAADASAASAGAFPKLTPRTFAEEDDDVDMAEPGEVPVMEELPVSQPPTYGPPPSYDLLAERTVPPRQPASYSPADFATPGVHGTARARGDAPPLPPPSGVQPAGGVRRRSGYGIDALIPGGRVPAQQSASAAPGAVQPESDQPGFPPTASGQPGFASPGSAPGVAQPGFAHGFAPPGVAEPPAPYPPVLPPRRAQPLPAPPMTATGRDFGLEGRPVVAESSDMLTAEWLLHGRRAQPGPGWRRTVYRASGGLIKVGESAANLRRRDLVNRVRTPVAGGHHRVAVMSLKGGVGKTTTAVGLGATLASLRGDRVVALDANPDRGTLSDKVRLETSATVRDLLNERSQIRRYADVRQFTSQASSRLEILASDRDPGVSIEFDADDYREVSRVIEHHYSIAITDCGTGLLHSAMAGILELADHIVLVSSPSVDGARSASATLDWLEAHRYSDLVRSAVVVLSTIRPRSKSTVDLDRLESHFASRCRDVVRIPYDAHLEEGSEVELDLLSTPTSDAYLALAATVADGFAIPRRAHVRPATSLP
jgi:MinD-like ATPase involved in chromosome partitioning or flagellar assembly